MSLPENKRREGIQKIGLFWTAAIQSCVDMWKEAMLASDTKALAVTCAATAAILKEAHEFFTVGAKMALRKHPEMEAECAKAADGIHEMSLACMEEATEEYVSCGDTAKGIGDSLRGVLKAKSAGDKNSN